MPQPQDWNTIYQYSSIAGTNLPSNNEAGEGGRGAGNSKKMEIKGKAQYFILIRNKGGAEGFFDVQLGWHEVLGPFLVEVVPSLVAMSRLIDFAFTAKLKTKSRINTRYLILITPKRQQRQKFPSNKCSQYVLFYFLHCPNFVANTNLEIYNISGILRKQSEY